MPPFASNATLYGLASHCAQSATVAPASAVRLLTVAPSANSTSPDASRDQPANVQPVRVNLFAASSAALPYVNAPSAIDPPVFPLPSYFTLYSFAFQTA